MNTANSFDTHEAGLYIVGAGGHGRELHGYIADLCRAGWRGTLCGYLDDGLQAGMHGGLRVLGAVEGLDVAVLAAGAHACYITALGNNVVRREIVRRLEQHYAPYLIPWTLVHPTAYIGEAVDIGPGTCIAPAALLTAAVRIGRHCIVNVKASVSHDCVVSDFVNINPSATVCGGVAIGEGAFIGAGATVREGISIGSWTIIGAGAVVTANIPANVTAVGVPARIVKRTGAMRCHIRTAGA